MENVIICGFPEKVLPKVEVVLEYKNINYIVMENKDSYKIDYFKDYKELNNYDTILENATREISIKRRIESINEYLLNNIDSSSIIEKIQAIEKIIFLVLIFSSRML